MYGLTFSPLLLSLSLSRRSFLLLTPSLFFLQQPLSSFPSDEKRCEGNEAGFYSSFAVVMMPAYCYRGNIYNSNRFESLF